MKGNPSAYPLHLATPKALAAGKTNCDLPITTVPFMTDATANWLVYALGPHAANRTVFCEACMLLGMRDTIDRVFNMPPFNRAHLRAVPPLPEGAL